MHLTEDEQIVLKSSYYFTVGNMVDASKAFKETGLSRIRYQDAVRRLRQVGFVITTPALYQEFIVLYLSDKALEWIHENC